MSTVQHHQLQSIADNTLATISGQLLLPQSNYVDVLLDLLVVAHSSIVRSAIADRLDEIRFVTMIATDEVRADLFGIVAISDFSDAAGPADDLAWAELAACCDCESCTVAVEAHASQLEAIAASVSVDAPEGGSR